MDEGRMKVVLDTNVLMNNPEKLITNKFDTCEFIIPSIVLEELDNLKMSENGQKASNARKGIRFIESNKHLFTYIVNDKICTLELEEGYDENKNDNKILDVCKRTNSAIFSLDKAVKLKAESLGIKIVFDEVHEVEFYTGTKEVILSDEELADFYTNLDKNKYNLLDNQYLIVKNEKNEVVDKYKWNGLEHEVLQYKHIQNKFSDKIKPRNTKQELAFDMLQDEKSHIKVLIGKFGTGKDLLMVNTALSLIERNKYQKIVWIVQNQQVAETRDIGALPGDINDKLAPYTSILADKLGGQFGLDMLINERMLEIIPLAFIRGRSFSNSILMLSESENTTKQHMQLIISRLGENSMLMVNGDFKQVDKPVFKENSGLRAMIDSLQGNKEFAVVMLDKTERSNLAELASLMD